MPNPATPHCRKFYLQLDSSGIIIAPRFGSEKSGARNSRTTVTKRLLSSFISGMSTEAQTERSALFEFASNVLSAD